jgi:hypothetical protein
MTMSFANEIYICTTKYNIEVNDVYVKKRLINKLGEKFTVDDHQAF